MKQSRRIETLPIEPLEELLKADDVSHLARILNTDRANVYRWRKDGIPVYKADQIACKTLGVHPGFIWRKEWVPR